MSGTPGPLLRVSRLHTQFATDAGLVKAVEDVSFTLDAGETLAVVGESGSGKSATSLSIMGLIADPPGRVAGGEILFRTRAGPVVDLVKLPARTLRKLRGRDIAMIFQEPMTSLNPVFSVGDQIAEAAILHLGMTHAAARRRALEMLELVEIPAARQRLDDYPHQLSGGMRQRVMIAIALACNPLLLIADEPTTALDVTIQAQILALIDKLRRDTGMAVLFITHNLGVVAEIADRVVVMYAGRVVEEADVRALFRAPRHPYTQGLLACLPRRALDGTARGPKRRLSAIAGQVASPLDPLPGCAFAPRCGLVAAECSVAMPGLGRHRRRPALALPALERAVSEPMLRVQGLKKYFGRHDRPVRAVDDVSFEIAAGEMLGLVGESGSGKSTIGRSVLRADRAERRFDPIRRHRSRAVVGAGDAAFPSAPADHLPGSVREPQSTSSVSAPRSPKRSPRTACIQVPPARHAVAELLSLVGLAPEHARRYPHEFSGGQRQRIGIARALAVEPRVHRRRRARLGARRLDPGAGHQPARRPAANASA